MSNSSVHYDTIIIGGGQAGLTTGYYLKQHNRDFIILDANLRTGDSWRQRWDSLRLFTPARYDGLPGTPFPASSQMFPTKNEMADYLESYAAHFELPVKTGVKVDRLSKEDDRFVIASDSMRFTSDNVVVAMANFQYPRLPEFTGDLDPGIVQMHSSEYRNLSQLQAGGVLIVGCGNSGAEIALEVAPHHPTWLSGKYPPYVPFRIEGLPARLFLTRFVLGFLFYHVLNIRTPIGRRARIKLLHGTGPLVRTKPSDVAAAGVEHVSRTVGIQDGLPVLEDGRILNVANVIWCTGYHPGFSWIDLPIIGDHQEPMHKRGIVSQEPGVYFVGLHFLSSLSSAQINGVGRDAKFVVQAIVSGSR